jgi:hypothetical protein
VANQRHNDIQTPLTGRKLWTSADAALASLAIGPIGLVFADADE